MTDEGNGEYVTRRELTLTLTPLIAVQNQQTNLLAEISKDMKRLLFQHEREVGSNAAESKTNDKRRFWLMITASLASGIVAVVVIAIAHAIH